MISPASSRSLAFSRLRHTLASPWLHVTIIVIAAGFFRLWQLHTIPPGLFGDEATDGLDALDVLAGRGAVFFPANYGREGLHMWILAAAFRVLGITPLALRLPSAIAGILTALATYWLGRELLNGGTRLTDDRPAAFLARSAPWISLLASLYCATSYFHVHFSRFGIRGVFTPLFGALAFAAFWRAVNRRTAAFALNRQDASPSGRPGMAGYAWFALSGLFLGLSLHFYTASRFLPLFLGGYLLVQGGLAWVRGRREEAVLRRDFAGIVLCFVVALLVFAPLGFYFLQHPGSFSQRASEVTALKAASPLARMAQAAAANVLQFFLPGRGDRAQFYNLPGRAVFDPLTAILAVIGIVALAWQWRRAGALFLLLWWPALLAPSFLATDRFPTLPRVLGVLPGVYFFPAVGVVVLGALIAGRQSMGSFGRVADGSIGERPAEASSPDRSTGGIQAGGSHTGLPLRVLFMGAAAGAVLIHAGLTYRDYFQVWGPATATFEAFEGDMTAASLWLEQAQPDDHVYLSSDIYRHPTFMLLGEHATVTGYFEHRNPQLSWFDARSALPLPPRDETATYLFASSSPFAGRAAALLASWGEVGEIISAPDGRPALTTVALPAGGQGADRTLGAARFPPIAFTDQLALIDAAWSTDASDTRVLVLTWQTSGSDPTGWPGHRLEIAETGGAARQAAAPFEAFRPPEWVAGGRFVTWHPLDVPAAGGLPSDLHMRLVRASDGSPESRAEAPDGWHTVKLP